MRRKNLLHQWLAWGRDRQFMQFGGDAAAFSIIRCASKAFAKDDDFVMTGSAPTYLGPAAGCGHGLLLVCFRIFRQPNL
ncbi:MAG: hypothetical protein WCF22_09340 [Candidatus Sulfotelmatobacter sp.]